MVGFSEGDEDVTLIEMAYIKRYGADIVYNGETTEVVMNRLIKNNSSKYYQTVSEDMLLNGKRSLTGLNNIDETINKYNLSEKDNKITLPNGQQLELTYTSSTGDSNGQKVRSIKLPNGKILIGMHAYSIDSYDKDSQTVSLKNPHDTSKLITIDFETYRYLFNITQ